MSRQNILLIFILSWGFFLRMFHLNDIPLGFFADEAIIAVDAESVIKTGRDSNGDLLPLFPKGFGFYDGGLPTYFQIPLILLFGKNDFSTRLGPVLFFLVTVIILYKIVIKLKFNNIIASIITLIYAFQPWTYHLARTNNKAHPMHTFFILLGFYFYLNALSKKSIKKAIIIVDLNPATSFLKRLLISFDRGKHIRTTQRKIYLLSRHGKIVNIQHYSTRLASQTGMVLLPNHG